MARFSQRSLNNLEGINPQLRKVLDLAIERAGSNPSLDFAVIQGVRSKEEQRKNVAKGVSQTMNSRHIEECPIDDNVCFGNAVDILPTSIKAGMNWEPKYFRPVLELIYQCGQELGIKLRFGNNWQNNPSLPYTGKFPDWPHVEIPR